MQALSQGFFNVIIFLEYLQGAQPVRTVEQFHALAFVRIIQAVDGVHGLAREQRGESIKRNHDMFHGISAAYPGNSPKRGLLDHCIRIREQAVEMGKR